MAHVATLEEAQGVARAHGHAMIETDARASDRVLHFSCQHRDCQAWFDVDSYDDVIKACYGLDHSCPWRGKTYVR
ncbi:MAG TPA: hypothetical protein VJY65_04510 [Chloroflexota bacterium]|nr:hypothetical protein [Chloroflexota bacterium]